MLPPARRCHSSRARAHGSKPSLAQYPAPVSKLNNEVSCYGDASIDNLNDYWVVEVVDDLHRGKCEKVGRIHLLTTRLRLRHSVLGCHLRAANKNLTEWVFKQIEASCDKENNLDDDPYTYWNVEGHWNDHCASPISLVLRRAVLT